MNQELAQNWTRAARQNLSDAELLVVHGAWRSAVSRAYYSAAASAHAVFLLRGATPPSRGNWSNPELPAMLFAVLKSMNPRDHRWRASAGIAREELAQTWALRLMADYNPGSTISNEAASDAVKCARRLLKRLENFR